MIRFFYSGCYKKLPDGDVTHLSRLTLHVEMYSLADKYDVSKLGEAAIANFQEALTNTQGSDDYLPCVRAIYESTPDSNTGLRSVIVTHVVNRYNTYRYKMRRTLLEAAFIEAPQFGWDCFLLLQNITDNKLEWEPEIVECDG